MISICLEPLEIDVQIREGQTLQDGLKQAGFSIEKPCAGMGICGECGVWIDPSEHVPPTPHETISKSDEVKGMRLACQAIPEGDITLYLPDRFMLQNNDTHQNQILAEANDSCQIKLDPAAKLVKNNNLVQFQYDRIPSPVILNNWKKDFRPKGLAIDLGTTTLAMSLVCLKTGKVLDTTTDLNPQVAFGHDVLTRIQYATDKPRRIEMAGLIQNKLNLLLADICQATDSDPEEIIDVTIGANTTMLQMAAGMDSRSIGCSPFNFDIKHSCSQPAALFGLNINTAANVYLPTILHAFIGTDISSGLLLCPDFFDPDKIVLFIDIGTNGEICLNARGKWTAASTAAGPAFEGMGISSGMRAMNGAVERVEFRNDRFKLTTIGNTSPTGICGSGIIDLMAELLRSGYMDRSGRLTDRPLQDKYVVDIQGVRAFQIGENKYFTQKDIRQIQLAISAVRTGIEIILKNENIKKDQIDTVYLAGGFGAYLKTENLSRIGIFDDHMAEKTIPCGNTSLRGSTALLINAGLRKFLETSLNKITYVSLSKTQGFQESFIANLSFPPST